MELYSNKQGHYFSNVRHDLISLLPSGTINRLLELGAGAGDTLVEIKHQGRAKEVVGIELMTLPGTNQQNPLIDKLLIGDFENFKHQLEPASFDVILCGDVLEHLVNPWAVVGELTLLLKPGGMIIISCPNARNYRIFIEIFLRGSFRYTDSGLFDKTHLRFFCKRDLIKMLSEGELKVTSVLPSFKFYKTSKIYRLNLVTLGLLEQFFAVQYMVCAKRG